MGAGFRGRLLTGGGFRGHGIGGFATGNGPAVAFEDTAPYVPLTKLQIKNASTGNILGAITSVTKGSALYLQAVYTPDNATDKGVTWTVNNPTMGTITPTGPSTATYQAAPKAGSGQVIRCNGADGIFAQTSIMQN